MRASVGFSIAPALRWILTGRALQVLLQVVGLVILARLLSPADFGLVASVGIVTALVQTLLDMGTGAALVQRQRLEAHHPNAVFWFNVCVGFLLAGVVIVAAPTLSGWLNEERLIPIFCWLSFGFPLSVLGATHAALLERESKFRSLMIRSAVASAAGLVIAILLALGGAGVYALVGQSLVMAATSTILLWRSSAWRPGAPSLRGLHDIASFSGNLFSFNLLNYVHRNADTAIVGRTLGQLDLGLYNVAYRFLLFPLQNITFAINKALLPAYSRRQSEPGGLAAHYIETLRGISLVTAPIMAAIWVAREPMVGMLLGPGWERSADVIQWLAPVGFIQSIVSTSGSVLAACGRTDTLRTLGIFGVPFLTASFLVGIPWGIEGVAAAYCIANAIWLFPVLRTVMRTIQGSLSVAFAAITLPAVIAAVAFFGASLALDAAGADAQVTQLLLTPLLGGMLFLLGVRILMWDTICSILSGTFERRGKPNTQR